MFCIPFPFGIFLLNARKIICHVYDNFAFELFILPRIKAERKAAASPRIPHAPIRKALKFNYFSKLQQAVCFYLNYYQNHLHIMALHIKNIPHQGSKSLDPFTLTNIYCPV